MCNDDALDAHAVTIYGYASTDKKITYWNPGSNNGNGGTNTTTYDRSGYPFLSMSGHAFSWGTTLSAR